MMFSGPPPQELEPSLRLYSPEEDDDDGVSFAAGLTPIQDGLLREVPCEHDV